MRSSVTNVGNKNLQTLNWVTILPSTPVGFSRSRELVNKALRTPFYNCRFGGFYDIVLDMLGRLRDPERGHIHKRLIYLHVTPACGCGTGLGPRGLANKTTEDAPTPGS